MWFNTIFIHELVYLVNHLSCQGETITVSVKMETKRKSIPMIKESCSFEGYDAASLMSETSKLRKIITKRGTLEILIPLCCTTKPVRYKQFKQTLKGISSKTLSTRLKELEKSGVLQRQSYNEIPPRVEYKLTNKGQELVKSVIDLLSWMKKWSKS
jgi:DNA-binding HxlR family transcriptional regulator